MKLITKIYLSIGFILLFFVFVTITFFQQAQKVDQSINEVIKSAEIIKSTVAIHRAIVSSQAGLRGYLLVGQKAFLDPFYEGEAEYLIEVNLLRKKCRDLPEHQALINKIDASYNNWKDSIADPIIASRSAMEQNARARQEYARLFNLAYTQKKGKLIIDEIKVYLKTLENNEIKNKNLLVEETTESHQSTNILGIVLTAAAILVGVITTILLGNTIQKRIISMKNLASNLAQGNFNIDIQDKANDELSSLAADMNSMAQQLEASFKRLQKMNQELDQFAYVVSHDLKAPLRAINNLAEWIKEDIGETTPEINTNLDLMRGRVQRMENLINGILEYARVGRKKVERSIFPIQQLLEEIIESLEVPPHFKIKLPQTNTLISTQRVLLHQVLANLIGNAIKYHDKPEGLLEVNLKESDNQLEFTIKDNGPGIPKEFHEKIFGVFQTIEARDTKESIGIGLAIVKKIIEERSGTIRLESEVGQGATFIFTWPMSVALSAVNKKVSIPINE